MTNFSTGTTTCLKKCCCSSVRNSLKDWRNSSLLNFLKVGILWSSSGKHSLTESYSYHLLTISISHPCNTPWLCVLDTTFATSSLIVCILCVRERERIWVDRFEKGHWLVFIVVLGQWWGRSLQIASGCWRLFLRRIHMVMLRQTVCSFWFSIILDTFYSWFCSAPLGFFGILHDGEYENVEMDIWSH